MRCYYCMDEGKKSTLTELGCMSTLMGGGQQYWDEDGKPHRHDPNTTTTNYRCSEGHQYKEKIRGACPSCDFGHEEPVRTLLDQLKVSNPRRH